jgi:methanogenic corrinoid protein MtbC1
VKILLISTLMLASALRVKEVRAMLDAVSTDVKLIVGGAPFRLAANLWREVGADAMGNNASDTIAIVSALIRTAP